RGMAEIMGERQGFGQVLVETERAADRARDLRHLETVRQPRAVVIALMVDKHLRFVGESPERGRVDDAVAVTLKRRAHLVLGLRMETPATLLRLRRKRRERSVHIRTVRRAVALVHSRAWSRGEWRRDIASAWRPAARRRTSIRGSVGVPLRHNPPWRFVPRRS